MDKAALERITIVDYYDPHVDCLSGAVSFSINDTDDLNKIADSIMEANGYIPFFYPSSNGEIEEQNWYSFYVEIIGKYANLGFQPEFDLSYIDPGQKGSNKYWLIPLTDEEQKILASTIKRQAEEHYDMTFDKIKEVF